MDSRKSYDYFGKNQQRRYDHHEASFGCEFVIKKKIVWLKVKHAVGYMASYTFNDIPFHLYDYSSQSHQQYIYTEYHPLSL